MERKIHLAPWSLVKHHKAKDRLGVPPMRALNAAFLMKLWLQIVIKPDKVWARVSTFKYCGGKGLLYSQLPPFLSLIHI